MRLLALVFVAALLSVAVVHAQETSERTDVLNVHQLPLGDGRISAEPRAGYVMSCTTSFRGGGARADVPWIHGDVWDLTQKISVAGRVMWPQAQFKITVESIDRVVSRIIEGNGLPVNTPTGNFPISPADIAFQFDRNPNSIEPQQVFLRLPMNPRIAVSPSCVPMGMIGVALNGVAIYNALDADGRDAVAHEVQDRCNGHPQMRGQYHYHGPSPCLPQETAREQLIGYALDGLGIYSMSDAQGRELTDADLDECHGRNSVVEWNGRRQNVYHYVLTREYPYTIGCFRGMPLLTRPNFGRPPFGMRGLRPEMPGMPLFPPSPPSGGSSDF